MAFEEYRLSKGGLKVRVQESGYQGKDLGTGLVSKVVWYPDGCFHATEVTLDDGTILKDGAFYIYDIVQPD